MKLVSFCKSFENFNFPSLFYPPTPFFFSVGEHYKLLSWLSLSIKGSFDISDIGTYQGASAYALSANRNATVYSYGPEGKVLDSCKSSNIFYITDIWENYIDDIVKSSLIVFDTEHDGVQENLFINTLLEKSCREFYAIVFDDIYLNQYMKDFWKSLENKSRSLNLYDFTLLGHTTGTGIVSVNFKLEDIIGESFE